MINSVRNTVLSVLNKNNYGYLSPSDFNLYSKNAQIELFEEYFSSINKSLNSENARMSGTDYADVYRSLVEAIEEFLVSDYLHPVSGASAFDSVFSIPTFTTTGNEAFMINKILGYTNVLKTGNNTAVTAFRLVDSTVDFSALGISLGDFVINKTTKTSAIVTGFPSTTSLTLNKNIFLAAGNEYSVYAAKDYVEIEKVSQGKISLLNNSNLTAPSIQFPAYAELEKTFDVYPVSFGGYGAVKATYFRYPKDPKWTYITLANGEPIFDQSQSDYQDFELPIEDEYKLVMKILQYAGISIRETEVTQFGMAQEQHEQPTFSQKQ